ncbi:trypsin-like serine protease [Fragilariopsis cylindrus CCMP1102]|uniref:Trypsin-like serine protease n=1 Tax=Fragilariopsis cylindrus CCMP1102 TaxID=635003 RepID=A0A1E7FC37_9STRA|nr:trypsin-like serine protease [Fragilariopsis cylindrus CCMP1102]|eukprot:OEU15721.1 trypsin-like serine protease [Fragilariopsis cylindrus CCMP1102]
MGFFVATSVNFFYIYLSAIILVLLLHSVVPFSSVPYRHVAVDRVHSLFALTVSVGELEKDLTPSERSITGVVRQCGPSVAFITSVSPAPVNTRRRGQSRRRQRQQQDNDSSTDLPRGNSLGSGSGFVVAPGYICTNYHVIERAYTTQKNAEIAEHTFDELAGNLTGGFITHDILNITKSVIKNKLPDYISFGASSDLLVGQSVVAIGNPFGLQSTVTAGVVSAVNRDFRAGTARTPANTPIRNVIQTDAAINPGNSGGPLLNLKGEVVGINTAIISTSGSFSGIGFAVPADQLKPIVTRIIREDRIQNGLRPNQGWLGISVIRQNININSVNHSNSTLPLAKSKNWVAKVERSSPAYDAGIRSLDISLNGVVTYGDAIVAVGGNEVTNFDELQMQLEKCVAGEKVAVTVQDAEGERRVVYVTLAQKPETKE